MVVPPFHTPKWSFFSGRPVVVGYHHFRKPPVENNAGAQGSLHDPTQRTPWLQLNHKFLGLPPTVSCPVTRPYDARPQRISLPCWPCNWFYDESLTNKNHNKRLLKGSKVELNPHFSVFIWARTNMALASVVPMGSRSPHHSRHPEAWFWRVSGEHRCV